MSFITPTHLKCRFSKQGEFKAWRGTHKLSARRQTGIRHILAHPSKARESAQTLFMCQDMEQMFESAIDYGDVGVRNFILKIISYDHQGKAELKGTRLEIEGIRLLFEAGKETYIRSAGIIMQNLIVAGTNLSGWMVGGVHQPESSMPSAYLARPSYLTHNLMREGITIDTTMREIEVFLKGKCGGKLNPPIITGNPA
ncbi:MAG: hypothetical protein U9R38_08215 [Candidatus Margulisiibacteriota bacterium]|nr:hypothetical protein [Candidatus Margulisiibacteriota bacterium]